MREETLAIVRKLAAAQLRISEDRIQADIRLAELGFDSLGATELVFELEDWFKISVSDEAVRGFKTVREVCDGIESLQHQPS